MTLDEFIRTDTFNRFKDENEFYKEVKNLWHNLRVMGDRDQITNRTVKVLATLLDWMDEEVIGITDRKKVEEWAMDFKAYAYELDIPREDYRGIIEYIDEALALFREREPVEPVDVQGLTVCGACGAPFTFPKLQKYCQECGRKVKWDG